MDTRAINKKRPGNTNFKTNPETMIDPYGFDSA